MNQNWHATLIRHLLLLITACLIGGLVSGYYGWSLAIGLALYLGWTLKQLLRLHDWLRNHQRALQIIEGDWSERRRQAVLLVEQLLKF